MGEARREEVARSATEWIARQESLWAPILAVLSLTPVAAALATVAVFDPDSAWYGPSARLLATWAPATTALGVYVLVWSLLLSAVSTALHRPRRRTFRWLTIALGACLSLGYQLTPGRYEASRHQGISRAQREGDAAVRAIAQFRAQYGRTPDRLEELVPEFLPSVPQPRLAGYPRFSYVREWSNFALYVPIPSWPDQVGTLAYRSAPNGSWRLETEPTPFDPRPLPKR